MTHVTSDSLPRIQLVGLDPSCRSSNQPPQRQDESCPAPTPLPGESDTRLTAKADFGPGVNHNENSGGAVEANLASPTASQPIASREVAAEAEMASCDGAGARDGGSGGRASENRVNHAQVVAPQQAQIEIQLLLGQLGVNLEESRVGRKHVFDDFLRGRLVSLLAMGLSIRQAGAALGLSHNAVWKELKRNPDLSEQVTAARFQAQIEPLLVILRESKRSWRAATWVVNYLQKQIGRREETPDERAARSHAETDAFLIRTEERSHAAKLRQEEREIEDYRRQHGIKIRTRKKQGEEGGA
jgi:hypothetical protein